MMNFFGERQATQIMEQVQREKDQLALLAETEKASNKFLVSRNFTGNRIVILQPPQELLTKPDALLLAAWLVSVADASKDKREFKAVLDTVQAPWAL